MVWPIMLICMYERTNSIYHGEFIEETESKYDLTLKISHIFRLLISILEL